MFDQELMGLGILFFFAIVGGILAVKLKQPAAMGLLLIGAIIGPYSLNLVRNAEMVDMISEIGSILLLFVIGLEFVIPKLMKIGFKALIIGVLKIGIIFFMGYEALILFGISQKIAMILGIMISVSSTVVIVKVLESKKLYNREEMPLLIGVLIMEDIFAVIVLAFMAGASEKGSFFSVFEHLIIALTILLIAYIIVLKLAKKIISALMKHGDEEIVTFIALGICAGFSYLAYALGLLPATGAFLAGSIVASLPEVKLFEHAIKPYTLTFTSLFFISIGTSVNFFVIKDNLYLILFLVAIIIITRFIAVGFVSFLFASFTKQQMIFSSMAMVSVGEFSLLIAKSAMKLDPGIDLVSIAAFLIFITAIIMSISITYYEHVTEWVVSQRSDLIHKPKSFANFMRMLTEEIDTDNTNSYKVKELLFKSFAFGLFILFIMIVWNKVLLIFHYGTMFRYGVHAVSVLLIALLVISIYRKIREMRTILAQIISNLHFEGSVDRSLKLLDNLVLALMLLLITIFSPLLIVVIKLPEWINLVSFILLVVVIIRFRMIFNMVHSISNKKENWRI
jgi:Kef-type K+ transport system membrane component KefB